MYKYFLLILIAPSLLGCAKVSSEANKVSIHSSSSGRQVDAEDKEYSVYSTLIDEMYGNDGSGRIMVFDETTVNTLPHADLATALQSVSKRIPGGIEPDILADFEWKNNQPRKLVNRLAVGVDYDFITREDLDRIFRKGGGWVELNASKRSRGIVKFSGVGFNRQMDQALVYTGIQSGPLTGSGYFVLLVAKGNSWIIMHKAEVWTS